VLDTVWMEHWIIRKRAAATVIYEGMYSDTGYFGNEASMGHIYTLAALEVSRAKGKVKLKPKVKAKAPAKAKVKAKLKAKAPPKPKAKKRR
jgi:nanoRNase/pAp phosphatase (c-di-AMP/oligoRNAs hydrolase)